MTIRSILENELNKQSATEDQTCLDKTIEKIKKHVINYVISLFEIFGIADAIIPKFQIDQTVYWLYMPAHFEIPEDLEICQGKISKSVITKDVDDKIVVIYWIDGSPIFRGEEVLFASEGKAQKEKTKIINETEAQSEINRLMLP